MRGDTLRPDGHLSLRWGEEFIADGREFGDFDDPEHLRVWGSSQLRDLLGEPAVAGEAYDDEPHRFGQLARQVWVPLLAHEGRF